MWPYAAIGVLVWTIIVAAVAYSEGGDARENALAAKQLEQVEANKKQAAEDALVDMTAAAEWGRKQGLLQAAANQRQGDLGADIARKPGGNGCGLDATSVKLLVTETTSINALSSAPSGLPNPVQPASSSDKPGTKPR